MNRCLQSKGYQAPSTIARRDKYLEFATTAAMLFAAFFGVNEPALAQGIQRSFPTDALRGRLVVTQPPDVVLNGRPDRLSPGARIRSEKNLLVLSASLAGREQLVNYTREPNGLIHDVWILSEAEAQQPREDLPTLGTLIPGERAERPKVDDGRTPFDQLPLFKP
ncbi:MAG: hypothetical protein RLZZ591_33 [Pseudomonadota bacterium]|jgi:hypothetical protein